MALGLLINSNPSSLESIGAKDRRRRRLSGKNTKNNKHNKHKNRKENQKMETKINSEDLKSLREELAKMKASVENIIVLMEATLFEAEEDRRLKNEEYEELLAVARPLNAPYDAKAQPLEHTLSWEIMHRYEEKKRKLLEEREAKKKR
jgi:hypothetical protein